MTSNDYRMDSPTKSPDRAVAGPRTSRTQFSDLLDQMRALTAASDGDAGSLALVGNLLTSCFASPTTSAALLHSWANGIESGEEYDRGRSQIHNNGFSKISLFKLDGGWNLRLHVWPAGGRDPRIHDHRWSFASIALAGSLDVMNYSVAGSADATQTDCYRLYDATGDGEKRLQQIESVEIRPSSSYRISAGDFHVLDYRDPHVVWNTTSQQAVTLMLSGPAKREYSHSYGVRDGSDVLAAPTIVDDVSAVSHVRRVASAVGLQA